MGDASDCGHIGARVAVLLIDDVCAFVFGISDGISGAFKTTCVTLNTFLCDDLVSHAVHLLSQAPKREAII